MVSYRLARFERSFSYPHLLETGVIHWIALAIIIIVAVVLRFYQLGTPSLWYDEAVSFSNAKLSWTEMLISPLDKGHPPFYFSVLKIALLFGDDEFVLRAPSVIFGILTIIVIYWMGRIAIGPTAGLIAALFLTVASRHIEYSQEARMYSLLTFAIAVASLGVLKLAMSTGKSTDSIPEWRYLALYGIGTLLALYTHVIALYFFIAIQGLAIWLWLAVYRGGKEFAVSWAVVNALLMLAWLPWAQNIPKIASGFTWLKQSSPFEVLQTLVALHGGKVLIPALAFSGLIAYGLYKSRKEKAVFIFSIMILVVAPLLIWITGFIKPIFLTRVNIWQLIGSSLLVGLGVVSLRPVWQSVAVILIAALGILSTISYYQNSESENWRGAVRYVLEHTDAETAVVFCGNPNPFLYYSRQNEDALSASRLLLYRGGQILTLDPKTKTIANQSQAGEFIANPGVPLKRYLLVHSHCKPVKELRDTLIQKGYSEVKEKEFPGVIIRWFSQPSFAAYPTVIPAA